LGEKRGERGKTAVSLGRSSGGGREGSVLLLTEKRKADV